MNAIYTIKIFLISVYEDSFKFPYKEDNNRIRSMTEYNDKNDGI